MQYGLKYSGARFFASLWNSDVFLVDASLPLKNNNIFWRAISDDQKYVCGSQKTLYQVFAHWKLKLLYFPA